MISDVSSIMWGFSIALNIIVVLIALPLTLLICCCCKRNGTLIQKDIKSIARNHKLAADSDSESSEEEYVEIPRKKKKVKRINNSSVKAIELKEGESLKDLDE